MQTTTSVLGSIVATVLMLAVTACGSTASDGADPVSREGVGESTDENPTEAADRRRITAAGIAAIVQRHLGRDRVKMFGVFDGDEPGSVALWIEMQGSGGPENFGLSVYSPQASEDYMGKPGQCPPKSQRMPGKSRCRVLDRGRTVMTNQMAQGFSDDNATGMVISGTAVTPEDGSAIAMYESYDRSPTITRADLEQILGDPSLSWLTDRAVIRAGEKITLQKLEG